MVFAVGAISVQQMCAADSKPIVRADSVGRDAPRPNIIFILADDLGYGELGCYGQKLIQTPALDRMAKEGIRFTRHYAGGPVCGPSRACLMTGKSQAIGFIKGNPGRKGERENLRKEDTTVAELLKGAGYDTACIGKWGLGPQGMSGYSTRKGFDFFVGYDTHVAAHNYYPKTLCRNDGKMKLQPGTYSHDVFTQEALAYLEQRKGKKNPFFLYLAYTIPHSPYNPPDLGPYADKEWPKTYKKYASMITRMDRDIGRALEQLEESGLSTNTLVIFTSDNGPQSSYGKGENAMARFFDSNGVNRGIKRDVYNGGVMEPFIAWWPGKIVAGSSSDHVSGFQDFLPTVCELAGMEAKPDTDGISYLPSLLGDAENQECHGKLYWEFISMSKEGGGRQSVFDVERNLKGVRYGRFGSLKLYDLVADPGETRNIASQRPEVAQELKTYLDTCRNESEFWPISMHDKGWKEPK